MPPPTWRATEPPLIHSPPELHRVGEKIIGASTPPFAWNYPPVFLLIILPLSLLPYLPSLIVWLLATIGSPRRWNPIGGAMGLGWGPVPVAGVLSPIPDCQMPARPLGSKEGHGLSLEGREKGRRPHRRRPGAYSFWCSCLRSVKECHSFFSNPSSCSGEPSGWT